jgi:predicted ABC-type ATPase
MSKATRIFVLAGVNGSGKSSLGEVIFNHEGSVLYNPDSIAVHIRALHPDISQELANGHAWQLGRSLLEEAIASGRDYRFETTLGGRSIPSLLEKAAKAGHQVHVWFCGLESAELHIQRVQQRVARGGHHIPTAKIHERWRSSRENLIHLLPFIHHLRVYDNSFQADPVAGQQPRPMLLLEMRDRKIVAPSDFSATPEWAQPIVVAAIHLTKL